MRTFNTKSHAILNSITALGRLTGAVFCAPVILFCSIPIAWITLWVWVWVKVGRLILGYDDRLWGASEAEEAEEEEGGAEGTVGYRSEGGSNSTPVFPNTPFASPKQVTNFLYAGVNSVSRLDLDGGNGSSRKTQ